MRWLTGDYPAAAPRPGGAGHLPTTSVDRRGEAEALNHLGDRAGGDRGLSGRGRRPGSRRWGICRDLGDRHGEADALNVLGIVKALTGDYPAAVAAQEEALGIFCDFGDRRGEADALNRLGSVRRMTGIILPRPPCTRRR